MSLLLDPNATITMDVRYYDRTEKDKFDGWSNASKINSVAGHLIRVPVAEFLTYFIFHKKKHKPARYPSITEVKAAVAKAEALLEEWISYNGKSLHVADDCQSLPTGITEYLGDAAAMTVANRIHGFTEADWTDIKELRGRGKSFETLDWEYASDGYQIVEIEAKGAFCDRVNKRAEVSMHKASIVSKKAASTDPKHPHFKATAIRYGMIASISQDPESLLTVRLVDPPGDDYERTPFDIQILKRLTWIASVIRIIGPRTHLSVALLNRIAALERATDLEKFDGVSLLGGSGNVLGGSENDTDRFFLHRSYSREFNAAGVVTNYDKKHLLFLGISRKWIAPIVRQQFKALSALHFDARSASTIVNCVITRHQLESEGFGGQIEDETEEGNHVSFTRKAVLHQSLGGLVFGLVSKSY
jgi:hypothetical protein